MEQFARVLGFLGLVSGIFMMAFPGAARQTMQARAEFARLSPGALRVLGTWEILTSALLVWLTMRPTAQAVRMGEFIAPEQRRAA